MSSEDARLNDTHKLIAYCVLQGMQEKAIAQLLGVSVSMVNASKRNPEFRVYLARLRQELETRLLSQVTTRIARLGKRFDAEAPRAFETLVELHRKSDRDGVRRAAAVDILDRAPNAPKVRREGSKDEAIRIVFGVQTLQNMKKALTDVGEDVSEFELIDLEPMGEDVFQESKPREITIRSLDEPWEEEGDE